MDAKNICLNEKQLYDFYDYLNDELDLSEVEVKRIREHLKACELCEDSLQDILNSDILAENVMNHNHAIEKENAFSIIKLVNPVLSFKEQLLKHFSLSSAIGRFAAVMALILILISASISGFIVFNGQFNKESIAKIDNESLFKIAFKTENVKNEIKSPNDIMISNRDENSAQKLDERRFVRYVTPEEKMEKINSVVKENNVVAENKSDLKSVENNIILPEKKNNLEKPEDLTVIANAKNLYDEGKKLFVEKKYNEAIASYNKCLEIGKDNKILSDVHLDLGKIYYFSKKFDSAKEHLNKAVELNSNAGTIAEEILIKIEKETTLLIEESEKKK